jgi:hypothetical protein
MKSIYEKLKEACCVPIGCFNLCVFIVSINGEKEPIEPVEIVGVEPTLTDTTIYGDHIAIHITENPLHIV